MGELEIVSHSEPAMGGILEVAITVEAERRGDAAKAARRTAQRVQTWASRLTRFSADSDLATLNADGSAEVMVRPTLAAVLRWAADAERRSQGVVDATMLDQRLAAESGAPPEPIVGERTWQINGGARWAVLERPSQFRFDLDGIAKGWLADRAADMLHGWPGVAVNADGDICVHADDDVEWLVSITDPRRPDADGDPLATLHLTGGGGCSRTYGVATSGTSIHRWQLADGRSTHHLIDRRTGISVETDVVQATIVASTAREAEMLAKSAVILGSREAFAFLSRSAALAAILLLDTDELIATPGTQKWLA